MIYYVEILLVSARVLRLPDFDRPFTVVNDASDYGISGVLLQESHSLAYKSCKVNFVKLNYITIEKEFFAIVHCLRTWRCFLEGLEFTMVNDHNPFVFICT